jgi:hypothetical protein
MEEIFRVIKTYLPKNKDITNITYARRIATILKNNNLKEFKKTIEFLKSNYTLKTYKSCLTAILVYLKALASDPDLIKMYEEEMKKTMADVETLDKKQEKTEKEEKNMVSRQEISKIVDNLKKIIAEEKMTKKYLEDYKKYMIINLYYLIPPVRNDFVNCQVYEDFPFFFSQDLNVNYILLSKKQFILNRYKTSNAYGTGNIVELPQELVEIIKKYIYLRETIFPSLKTTRELLLTTQFLPMNQVHLTQILNRIFQKNVSSTILRKSYLTEKYPVTNTIETMEKDAKSMQHSVAIQQKVYRKK